MTDVLIIGIAGASGSGKSLFAQSLINQLPSYNIILIQEDAYYNDLTNIPANERTGRNFDHPDAFDHSLLVDNIKTLKSFKPVQKPIYDYKTHTRLHETISVKPAHVIIIEGILVLYEVELVELMDIRLFFDVDPDICFIRRLKRDISERGRDLDSVIKQYSDTVKPMFFQYVLPSKRHAHLIIPQGGKNQTALNIIKSQIESFLEK
jgi:uridine kinase